MAGGKTPAGILRRTRSKWFARGRARGPKDVASVVALTAWRLALESIKRMRKAQFEIEADAQYFDVLAEWLVFLAALADRLAQPHYALDDRAQYTAFIVRRLGENLAENRARLLGEDGAALAAARRAFIDRYNERAEQYAGYDCDAHGPAPAFVRHCAHALQASFGGSDRYWLADQVMTVEAPAAWTTLRTVFDNLIATAAANDDDVAPPAGPEMEP